MFNVTKIKTNRKWELNTCDLFMNLRTEDFFMGRYDSNIYPLWIKYYQKYIQEDMYSVLLLVLYEGSLKGDANSHLARSLWDEQNVHIIKIEKLM